MHGFSAGSMSPRRTALVVLTLLWLAAADARAAEVEKSPPAHRVAAANTFDKQPFSYCMELRSENDFYRVYRLTYPSPMVTTVEPNNTVPADYYLPKGLGPGAARRPAVLCLHILHGNFELEHIVCSMLARRGIPSVMIKLPYYGERSPNGRRDFLIANPKLLAESLVQGIQDSRRTIDVLAARPEVDPQRIGVVGISMGAMTAATVAGNDSRVWRAGLVLAGGGLLDIIHHARETREWSQLIRRLPAGEREAMERAIGEVDPLRRAAALREPARMGRVLMINAGADEVIPRDCTERLADALGMRERVIWLEGLGHYTAIAALPQALRTTADFFAEDLPPDARAAAAPSARTPVQTIAAILDQAERMVTTEPSRGRCHLLDLDAAVTLQNGKRLAGSLRYVRGSKFSFRVEAKVPNFGEAAVGQGTVPWMASAKKTVFLGRLAPDASPSDPLAFIEPSNLTRLQMLGGALSALTLVPDTLQRWVTVADDKSADGEAALRVTRKDRPQDTLRLAFKDDGATPARLTFAVEGVQGEVTFRAWQLNGVGHDSLFEPPADRSTQTVEAADLCRMFSAVVNFAVESSYSARTERGQQLEVVSRDPAGHGLLCRGRQKTVLLVRGSPEEMGTAHGRLLSGLARKLCQRTLYLVGAGDSIQSGVWSFERMKEIERRTSPHVPARYLAECDAMAKAAGVSERDARAANLFAERFHCSGLAVRGKATKDGRVLHARVLDYMRDIHLQDAAVVTVFMPEGRNQWISHGYAGFIGTVTAMNERGLAVGEMGGRGEGDWDGMPMSLLLRDLMERAATVEEALDILRKTPRTCEYYYVLSDRRRAMAAVHCDPRQMTVLRPGEQDPRLPRVPEDTVLISGPGRAEALSRRVQESFGRIDVPRMIEIIKRPVAMNSNLHDAVFSPETLDLWVSDAGRRTLACDEPYAKFNLRELVEFYERNIAGTQR